MSPLPLLPSSSSSSTYVLFNSQYNSLGVYGCVCVCVAACAIYSNYKNNNNDSQLQLRTYIHFVVRHSFWLLQLVMLLLLSLMLCVYTIYMRKSRRTANMFSTQNIRWFYSLNRGTKMPKLAATTTSTMKMSCSLACSVCVCVCVDVRRCAHVVNNSNTFINFSFHWKFSTSSLASFVFKLMRRVGYLHICEKRFCLLHHFSWHFFPFSEFSLVCRFYTFRVVSVNGALYTHWRTHTAHTNPLIYKASVS